VIILIRIGSPNRLLGLLKPSAAQAVSRLHAPGVNTVLLTGDNQGSATTVGEQLGIRHIVANVLPADKADKVAQLKRDGHTVAMASTMRRLWRLWRRPTSARRWHSVR
jgi:Cu+-exporting ATPase